MRFGLFVLLSVVISTSFGQTKNFKSKLNGFEFSYPDDWSLDTLSSNPMVLAPKDDTSSKYPASLQILSDQTEDTIDTCFKTHVLDWYPEQVEEFKINAEGSQDINGHKFKWIEFKYQKVTSLRTTLIYMTVEKGRVYLIEGRTSSEKYPYFKSKFIEMINSFKFRSPLR